MRRILRGLEAALLVAGGALLAVFALAALHQRALAAWDRAAFERAPAAPAALRVAHEPREAAPDAWREPLVDTTRWSAGRIAKYLEALEAPAAFGAPRLALLEIPAIDLSVVVLDGTDDWTLNRGVGRIPGTGTPGGPGNAGIAGHRDGFFRGLERVKEGDLVQVVRPGAAAPHVYRIAWLRVVRPEDVWVLDPTDEPSLTLVTCHPFYWVGNAPERYIVRAVALDEALPGRERAEGRAAARG
jgi:sortase A